VSLLIEAIGFGVAVTFMFLGLMGVLLPLIPGIFLIWLTLLVYAVAEGFRAIDWITFSTLTLLALVTGTSDLWMTLLGSKKGGAAWQAVLFGFIVGVVGFFVLGAIIPVVGSLVGGAIGYSLGVLLGQYVRFRQWRPAVKASLGGLAGWGLSTVIQLVGGTSILVLFVWQVLRG